MDNSNKVLNQFSAFLPWAESLRVSAEGLWLKPIAAGKWCSGNLGPYDVLG